MAEIQSDIMNVMVEVKRDIAHLKDDVHMILRYLEDVTLTEEEKSGLDKSILKAKEQEASYFVHWKDAKKELEL
jgi:beta-glucosidase-like glycosyl hydrolase